MPPDGHLVLYVTSLDRAYYYPQYEVNFDTLRKTWIGKLGVVGEGEKTVAAVALVGNSGRILYDHDWQVAQENNVWTPLHQLTEDTIICDAVHIRGFRPYRLSFAVT